MLDEPFKQCSGCGVWFTLKDILERPDIEPIGLCFENNDPRLNSFFFNHEAPGCGTTFLIPVDELRSLLDEPVPETILTNTEHCEHRCGRIDDYNACGQACHYAPYRRLLLKLAETRQRVLTS